MRHFVLLLSTALPLCLAACSGSHQQKLQGKWLGDSITNVAPEQAADATAWVKGVSFEFKDDKMTVTIPAEQPRTGTFKVEDASGDSLKLQVTREGGEVDSAKLVMTDDKLHWDIGDGREVVLTRLQ